MALSSRRAQWPTRPQTWDPIAPAQGRDSGLDEGAALHHKAKLGAIILVVRMIALQLLILGGDVYLRGYWNRPTSECSR